ncbi:MAG: tetratricopeptide repeat protein, partial [Chloroflexi bacterium]|nr:tetratricopeptide repeat protein [Chloroflexota bacterium]
PETLLVLDDYHFVASQAVHSALDYLLNHRPPALRLLISTRTDPLLSLARLRARGDLAELRARDLRLTPDEIAALASRPGLPPLSAESLRALAEKTEGWPAGVALALNSLAGKDAAAAERFIADFQGTQRFVFDYLAEEVFRLQPEAIQQFLLRSSVLPLMDAAACNAVLQRADSADVLAELERRNLFITSLEPAAGGDEPRPYYRYHQLFRDFLLDRLYSTDEPGAWALQRAAGAYYAVRGELDAATAHYLKASAYEEAAEAIAALAPGHLASGRAKVLYEFLRALPVERLRARPALLVTLGDILRRWGEAEKAVARYEEARAVCAASGDASGLARALTGLAEVARSQGDYLRARDLAALAVEAAPATEHVARTFALMALARSAGFLEGMDHGRRLAEKALEQARLSQASLPPGALAQVLGMLGQICWWHGDPAATVQYCRDALRAVPDELSPMAAQAYIAMATPYLYWCDLDSAHDCAERGLALCRQLQLAEYLPLAYMSLGNVLTRRGELARAESILRQAIDSAHALGLESYALVMAHGFLAFNLSQQGRVAEARKLAEGVLQLYAGRPDTYEMCVCRSLFADLLLDLGELAAARAAFAALVGPCERGQFRIPLAMVYFALAYLDLCQDKPTAREWIEKSLGIIAPTGAVQLWVDQGKRAKRICQTARQAGLYPEFVEVVLARLPRRGPPPTARPKPATRVEAVLKVKTLGGFRVACGGKDFTPALAGRGRDLLAYFFTFRREAIPLERVVEALWPEAVPERGRAAFHTALYRLRGALREAGGPDANYIAAEFGDYRLERELFDLDADEFEAACARARTARTVEAFERAVALYRGDFLDNLYADWCAAERDRLHHLYLAVLAELAAVHLEKENCADALTAYQRLLAADPLREDVHREVLRLYHRLGNRPALIRHYETFAELLRSELGVGPMPETQTLYAQLIGG